LKGDCIQNKFRKNPYKVYFLEYTMLNLKEGQLKIFVINLIYLLIFLYIFLGRRNYEFVGYIFVVVLLLMVILLTNKKVNYSNFVLWGLTLWGLMHMFGGGLLLNNGTMKLYALILIPLSETYQIFRYDQLVHIIGFGVSTLIMIAIIKPHLRDKLKGRVALGIVIIMAGLGVGAVNEIIEFTATVFVPETGVGGYVNNSLDLVSDLIGAILAWIYIVIKKYEI